MSWKKAIGFGVALWLIMFALISAAVAWGVYDSVWTQIIAVVIVAAIALAFSYYTEMRSYLSALEYGASWVIISFVLDYLVSMRFNPELFSSWTLWLGYALVLLIPLARVDRSGQIESRRHGAA